MQWQRGRTTWKREKVPGVWLRLADGRDRGVKRGLSGDGRREGGGRGRQGRVQEFKDGSDDWRRAG